MRRIGGYLLVVTAFIACPCHLVLALPVILGLFGGTALATALGANTGWVIAAATIYFVGALAAGFYLLNRRAMREESPKPPPVRPAPKHRAHSRPRAVSRRGR